MITKTKAYTSSDGAVHASLEAAQRAELTNVFTVAGDLDTATTWTREAIVDVILENTDHIKDVLTTKARSRPAARVVNGATRKKRDVKPAPVAHDRVTKEYAKLRAEVDGVTA